MTSPDTTESETLYRALFGLRPHRENDTLFLDIWSRAARLPADRITRRALVGLLHKSGDLLERGVVRLSHGERLFLTPILRIWERHLSTRLKTLDAEKLARIITSFRAMSVVPTSGFTKDLLQHFDLATPDVHQGVNVFMALADLGQPADDRLTARILNLTGAMGESESLFYTTLILRAAGLMDSCAPSPVLKRIAQDSMKRLRTPQVAQKLTESSQFMIRYACLWFGLDLPEGLIEKHPKPMTVSRYENAVRDLLTNIGFRILPQTEAYFPELDKETDFAIRMPSGTIHVELDGPYHFAYPLEGRTEQYNGSTVFMTALLGKLHPDTAFIRLPFFNLENLQHKKPGRFGKLLTKQFADAADRAANGNPATFVLSMRGGTPNLRPLRRPQTP